MKTTTKVKRTDTPPRNTSQLAEQGAVVQALAAALPFNVSKTILVLVIS
jgi:hypothetical protein